MLVNFDYVLFHVFTTYELVDQSHLKVVKKSGRAERFVPMKIYAGLFQACLYSKESTKGEMAVYAQKLTDKVLLEVAKRKKKTISSEELRSLILAVLRKESPPTFLKYLSYVNPPVSSDLLDKEIKRYLR